MEFGFSPTQVELYEGVKRFARSLPPAAAGAPAGQRELFQRVGRAGLLGLGVPAEWGGLGLDAQTSARAMEAFGEGCTDMGLVFACAAHTNACAMPILEGATPQ